MYLLSVLGIESVEEIDPTRPLTIRNIELGTEAATEAVRILQGNEFPRDVEVTPHRFERQTYWAVHHQTDGEGEIFGFRSGDPAPWPTALEVAIIRALAAAPEADHEQILSGDCCISLGSRSALEDFRKIALLEKKPITGESILSDQSSRATIRNGIGDDLSSVALNCLENSLQTSPLKFRFLELYRMIEARFLADIKAKLIRNFDAEPAIALSTAADALKSEMTQIAGLALNYPEPFEACWTKLSSMKNENRFTAALFQRVEKKGHHSGGKSKFGAALIYQMRCAIVHAGEKDMIFEKYPDGDAAISAILPDVERAAFLLVGVELS